MFVDHEQVGFSTKKVGKRFAGVQFLLRPMVVGLDAMVYDPWFCCFHGRVGLSRPKFSFV